MANIHGNPKSPAFDDMMQPLRSGMLRVNTLSYIDSAVRRNETFVNAYPPRNETIQPPKISASEHAVHDPKGCDQLHTYQRTETTRAFECEIAPCLG